MITDNKVKAIQKLDSEHYDASKKLKKEIETLRSQIQVKDSIIEKLKDIDNSDKRKERKDIQRLLLRFKEVMATCEEQIKLYAKDQPGINQILLELNSKHNKAEEIILQQLSASKQEVSNLKEKMRILSEQNYPEIIRDLEHQLMYANNELDHAKRNLIEYITSLNRLEDIIKENHSMSISENDEIERLRLENHRLNEENSSLIDSKKQTDKYFTEEIEKLKKENYSQKTEINTISREYDKLSLTIATVCKNLEVWREREQIIRENYDRMEFKFSTAADVKVKVKEFSKSEIILRSEEDAALREEHKKMEKLLQLSQEKWSEEKAALNEEISALRDRLNTCEDYFTEMSDKMNEESKVFIESRTLLINQIEQLKSRILETESIMRMYNNDMEKSKADFESKEQELVVTLNDDLSFLKNKLREQQEQNEADITQLNKAFEEKLIAQTLREETLYKQIDELKLELSETEQSYESYKTVNQNEINSMISELNKLRRLSNIRQDQFNRREKKLKAEVQKTKSILASHEACYSKNLMLAKVMCPEEINEVDEKDPTTNAASRLCKYIDGSVALTDADTLLIGYQRQVNKLHNELAKKARILQVTKKKLRNEQLKLASMAKTTKLFDFKSLQSDLEYLQEMNQNKNTNIIDEKLALSSLVSKLQQYVFDVEQSALKDIYNYDEMEIKETNEFEEEDNDDETNLNYKLPLSSYDFDLDDEAEGDENSFRAINIAINKDSKQRDSKMQIPEKDIKKRPLLESTSSANNYSEGSYSQKYIKKKSKQTKDK